MSVGRVKSMTYLVATLTQIASTLSDFGFKDESTVIERVSRDLRRKVSALAAGKSDQT